MGLDDGECFKVPDEHLRLLLEHHNNLKLRTI